MKEVIVASVCRTAIAKYLGTLKDVEPQEYAAHVVKEAAKRANVGLDELDEVMFGEVFGYTPNIARCAALLAGVPIETPAHTVDRQCASSMEALHTAFNRIVAEDGNIIMVGGVESMSRHPYYLDPSVRANPLKLGNKPVFDAFNHGVEIVQPVSMYPGLNMGLTAENVADKYNITREEMTSIIVKLYESEKFEADEGDVTVFTDNATFSPWAVDFVGKAAALGVITGNPDGTFNALGNATRAEAAVIFSRFLKLL